MSEKVGITELVARFGDDAIGVQMLAAAMSNISTGRDGVTKVTFGTQATTAGEALCDEGRVGIVLWVERETFDRVRKEIRESVG